MLVRRLILSRVALGFGAMWLAAGAGRAAAGPGLPGGA